jgi:uncharacterized protein YkwD
MIKINQFCVLLAISLFLLYGCRREPVSVRENEIFLTELLFVHNVERGKQGLAQLQLDSDLMTTAQEWAETMAARKRMFHGNTFMHEKFKLGGENIARGQDSIDKLIVGWMNSTSHRNNILNTEFTHAGLGYARASNGDLYWCVQFGGD